MCIRDRRGTAFPVDPGQHTFGFEAAGFVTTTRALVLTEGEKTRRERVVLPHDRHEPQGGDPSKGVLDPTKGTPPTEAATSNPSPVKASRRGTQRTLGLMAGGVGAGSVALGIVFGVLASSKKSAQLEHCRSSTDCTDRSAALDDRSTGTTYATVSTIGIVAGALLLGASAALYLTAPRSLTASPKDATRASSVAITPSIAQNAASLLLRGTF